jgi:small subunit ribosomal protein S2
MQMPTTKEMIAVGAHFGHKKDKTHPKAAKLYGFGIKDGIYIIDLDKAKEMLADAMSYISKSIKEGKTILFVGTKRQAQDIIKKTAEEAGVFYINHRWLGGMLTNFSTIKLGIKKLKNMEIQKQSEEFKEMTKQEQVRFDKLLTKLKANLDGIKDLEKLPDVLFIVDVVKEDVAVKEAKINNIPIVGICDMNANPAIIDYPIPANDDSKPTIEMIVKLLGETILEAKKGGITVKKEK